MPLNKTADPVTREQALAALGEMEEMMGLSHSASADIVRKFINLLQPPDGDTYPTPAHGWTCFHCGETFMNPKLAKEHFTAAPTLPPECLDAASGVRKLARRVRVAERECAKAKDEREHAMDMLDIERGHLSSIRRQLGIDRDYDPRYEIDFLQGRVIAAEAVVEYIEKRFPLIVSKARHSV